MEHVKLTIRHAIAGVAILLVSMGVATAAGRTVHRVIDRWFTVQTGEATVYYPPER